MRRPESFSAPARARRGSTPAQRSPVRASAGVRDAARTRKKAEKAEFKRFTQATRRRRWAWGVSLGGVALVLMGTVVLALSPALSLKEVRVEGAQRVAGAEVQAALAELYGEPLARVSDDRVGELLAPITLIQAFSTRIEPPHTLVLSVAEREPLGVVSSPSGFSIVDAAAVTLWSETVAPARLPLILVRPDTESPSFVAISRVLLALPGEIFGEVEGVTATTLDNVRFTMRQSDHEVVWGSAERSREKARVLAAALRAAGVDSPKVIDVTTPDSVVVRQRG